MTQWRRIGPGVYGDSGLLTTGIDSTGLTAVNPGSNYVESPALTYTWASPALDSEASHVVQDEATAVADATIDLWTYMFWGCFYRGLLECRSPDGDTISVQWFVDGVAYGSAVTFDSTEWVVVDIGDVRYLYEEYWLGTQAITIRTWGGEAHLGHLVLGQRTHAPYDLVDYLDTADSAYSSADTSAPSGGPVVARTPIEAEEYDSDIKAGADIPNIGTTERLSAAVIMKSVSPLTSAVTHSYGTPYTVAFGGDPSSAHAIDVAPRWWVSVNGTPVNGLKYQYGNQIRGNQWEVHFSQDGYGQAGLTETEDESLSAQWFAPTNVNDDVQVGFDPFHGAYAYAAYNGIADLITYLDRLYLSRQINDPIISTAEGTFSDPYPGSEGDQITFVFSHSDAGLIDHYEAYVFDGAHTTIVQARSTVTSPWDWDTTGFPDGTYEVVIVAVYASDDSESYAYWGVTIAAGVFLPQIYRRTSG